MRYQLFLISLLAIGLLAGCAKFFKVKLSPVTYFSLPLSGEKKIRIMTNQDSMTEWPSEFYIHDKTLYLADKANDRILLFNRDNELAGQVTNQGLSEINLTFEGSNMVINPLMNDKSLFHFSRVGQVLADDDFIYAENILGLEDEEQPEKAYSLVLKFDRKGTPLSVFGIKTRDNRIYPFIKCEKFNLDLNKNLFVYTKLNENWSVREFDKENSQVFEFSSANFFTNKEIGQEKSTRLVIEDMDNSNFGDFLLVVLGYFKNDVIYEKTVYYKVNLKDSSIEKLFTLKNERYNFIQLDNSNLVYLLKTLDSGENENIVLSLYNLNGQVVKNYLIEFDRQKAQWLNFRVQKDKVLAGLCLKDGKLNVMRWK